MMEAVFVFSWYLLFAGDPAMITAGSVQTEDRQECEAARRDKSLELSQTVASKDGFPISGSGWLVGACKRQ